MRMGIAIHALVLSALIGSAALGQQQAAKAPKNSEAASPLAYPPVLPGGQEKATVNAADLLKPAMTLRAGVAVAKTPPAIDLMYFPGQDYPGKPWSVWGDSVVAGGKYYASIGDHLAVDRATERSTGNCFVYEYDPATRTLRRLVDVMKLLNLPAGHYTPGKIHGRLDMGSDGWLYFSTHRGSTGATTDKNHYQGDWIIRTHPGTGKSEVIACGPIPKHCIPSSVLDPQRLIFYGGTASGDKDAKDIGFFAYDVKAGKVLYSGLNGPARYMILARSTGKVYYVPGTGSMIGPLMRYDPARPSEAPMQISAALGLRSATQETADGYVYTVSNGHKDAEAMLYRFNVKTEAVETLGPASVGGQAYITSIDADPTGRYLYYVPGAHGGSEKDGAPLVQFDTQSKTKKVIAFFYPYFKDQYDCTLRGTFSTAVDEKGETVYITWSNIRGGGRNPDSCVMTAVHIPELERRP